MGTLLMSIILSQICRLGKSIRIYYIQIICDSDYNKAYAWYILTLSAIAICYLWENYPAFSIYRVSTYVVYKNTMKYKKILIYHTGEKSVIHNLCLVNYFTNYYTYKVQISNHTGEKPLYSLKCYCRTHTNENPYQYSICYNSATQTATVLYQAGENQNGINLIYNETHMGNKPYQYVNCKWYKIQNIYISYHIEEMQLHYSIWHHMSLKGENKYLILHDGKLINIFIMSYMNGNHKIILLQNGGYK